MRSNARVCGVSALLALLSATSTFAQLMDEIPHAPYYAAVEAFHGGEYKTAERELRREAQRGVRTAQTRWIDSICYHAMLGEVLYQEGRNADALAEFDQACQQFLAYPNWLLQVKFQAGANGPRPDPSRARRAPPWGQSSRSFVLGQFPNNEQVLVGDLDAQRAYQQGGVVREPMFWRVNVVEIMRATALAIRRRTEILGPLSPQDSLSKELSLVLARGGLAPANHWSNAWIDVLHGLAEESVGKLDEAEALLGRALVVSGQLDHPLTPTALLEQGRVAVLKGDQRRAAQLFAEAGFSAFYFDDWDVLTDSALHGWINHMAMGVGGVYPPLEPMANWAQTNRMQHTAVKLRLAQAESLLWQGQLAGAATLIEDAGRRMGEMRGCVPAVHHLYVQAALFLLQGKLEAGGEALTRALAAQAGMSKRNFQIQLTSQLYDAGKASPRLAVDFYKALLADPSPADWMRDPLDSMAVLQTDQSAGFERWFLAALERKDPALALEVAERTKRRQYLASQPFGGRLLALRAILETPVAELSSEALLERQKILATFANYQTLADAAQKVHDQLASSPIMPSTAAETKSLGQLFDTWGRNVVDRQGMLIQLAVRRLPTASEFPPFQSTADLQKSLAPGEALVEFQTAAGNLYGFVLTSTETRIWQLPESRKLRNGLSGFLKALGNYGANRQIAVAELKDDAWRVTSKQAYEAIFTDAKLDLTKVKGLIIVPDDLLWYLPFECLTPGGTAGEKLLADLFPMRYGPTAALAVARPQPLRRAQRTAVVANDLKFGSDNADREALVQELKSDLTGPVVLGESLSQPANLMAALFEQLVVMDDVAANAEVGEAASIMPRTKGNRDALNNWVTLPSSGPEQIVLTGFSTEAEQGLKISKRGAKHAKPGGEIFESLCNLMSGGARTILITRWRTGGRTNFDLVREFAKESAASVASDAWQRACLLAREAPLDMSREPRLKRSDETGDLPKADHPFFWAGYLLVDTGPRPEVVEEQPAESSAKDGAGKKVMATPEAARGEPGKAEGDKMDDGAGDPLPPPDKDALNEEQKPGKNETDGGNDKAEDEVPQKQMVRKTIRE